jgi:hypothetical protein
MGHPKQDGSRSSQTVRQAPLRIGIAIFGHSKIGAALSVAQAVNRLQAGALGWHLDNEGTTNEQEDLCEPASYRREGIQGFL